VGNTDADILVAHSLLPSTVSEAEKKALSKRLRTLEVCEADSVVVEWTVRTDSDSVPIKGKKSAGRVKLASQSDPLTVYLTRRDLDAESPPFDLCEEFRVFCGINDAKMAILLQHIFLSQNEVSVGQLLEQNGITLDHDEDGGGNTDEFGENTTESTMGEHIREKNAQLDRFGDLVRGIEGTATMYRTQHWRDYDSGELDPLLARVCELDNQSTSLLLPGRGVPDSNQWGGLDVDGARVLQVRTGGDGSSLIQAIDSGAVIWPAVFIPSREGSKVIILCDEDEASSIDTELCFLGEFMVSNVFVK